ncbi:hypothetical protein RSOLAG1IB_09776 [Rhizoctonia solani AG-1 IB]|uniref:Protein kinase domain-containing protein n=1 Tax=Thanatephorus cucumeris (strain AG1-IB / isolate 7/3/14) TaxID=1108050 RepID=A0A0B7FTV5_THACB|nr:hypothetical protein RSOLAG1IB_09776 [Rhizoctonia solani AG-1 IB]
MESGECIPYAHTGIITSSPEELSDVEKRWVAFQPYLLSKGYQLRPRYRPGWIPSWKHTNWDPMSCEDSGNALPIRTLDATRLSDHLQVIIKMIIPSNEDREGEEELDIVRHVSSSPYSADPRNHTVECLESFAIPGVDRGEFFVMPLLREYNDPPFRSLDEIRDFLVQIFEGLVFLHENDIAHCDIASANIMMNGRLLFKQSICVPNDRFGIILLTLVMQNGFVTPTNPGFYDPFKANIYQLGAVLRRDLIPQYPAMKFLLPLSQQMTDYDLTKRPTLGQAYQVLITQFNGLSRLRICWPLVTRDASLWQRYTVLILGAAAELVLHLKQLMTIFLGRAT